MPFAADVEVWRGQYHFALMFLILFFFLTYTAYAIFGQDFDEFATLEDAMLAQVAVRQCCASPSGPSCSTCMFAFIFATVSFLS